MEALFSVISVIVYCVLATLALWGAYNVTMVWRRVAFTRFRSEEDQEGFLEDLDQYLRSSNLDEAANYCEPNRRALPQLAIFAMMNRHLGKSQLRRLLAERFQQDVLADIEHRLSWVATVVKAAPMVGLLGTVIGMMGAFANISVGESVDANAMAEDIHFALITTACGLGIAVPLVLATASITIRIRKMEDLVSIGLARLFDLLVPHLAEQEAEAALSSEY